MTFLPDIRNFEKFVRNDWKTLLYAGREETWDEKLLSTIHRVWHQIVGFFDSRGKEFFNRPTLYAVIFVGSLIVLGTFKYVRHGLSVKLTKNDKTERRIGEKIISEDSGIVANDGNEENENLVENSRRNRRSDINDAIFGGNNDHPENRRESNISSNTTIVANETNEKRDFMKNLIESIKLGDDGVVRVAVGKNDANVENDKEIPEQQESTRQKVDSMNCKHFYVLTPWIGDRVDVEFTEGSSVTNENESLSTSWMAEKSKTSRSAIHNNFIPKAIETNEINKNVFVPSKIVNSSIAQAHTADGITDEENSTGQTTHETSDSTLATCRNTSSVCDADEVISPIIENEKYVISRRYVCTGSEKFSKSSDMTDTEDRRGNVERVLDAGTSVPLKLPELDLSPISHNPARTEKNVNVARSEIRTDSKHRFRSLSHENRTVSPGRSSAEYFNTRRGTSVSPPARNKNKQRSTKQMQSKIPTLSPLAHRAMQDNRETDGSQSETANQIRSVLLRKLREVWEQHPRNTTGSPNYSRDSSFENSVYSTPEGVSRIPLPRRSPFQSNARSFVTPWTPPVGQSDRATDQSGQSAAGYFGTTSEREDAAVPLHSTPKSSPLSRGSNHRHGL